jgi:hypothetical protein
MNALHDSPPPIPPSPHPTHVSEANQKELTMEQYILDLSLLLMYLTGWEEDKRNSSKGEKCFKAWVYHKYEILTELQNQGLIRFTPAGKTLTVLEKGKQAALELKKKLLADTDNRFLEDLHIQSWTKSLLPCPITADDQQYASYIELMESMRMPEIEKIILGKLADLKIVAQSAISQFFARLK